MGKKGISEEQFQAEMKIELEPKEYNKTREWNKYAFGSKKLENLILGVPAGIVIVAGIILILF